MYPPNNPQENPISNMSFAKIEKIKNNEVIVISGKTEEELINLAIEIFNKIEQTRPEEITMQSQRCREELSTGDKELRPMGYAIYLRKGQLFVDSRNHRTDQEMKDKLEKIVISLVNPNSTI